MHAALGSVHKAHIDPTEVVLRELARQPLEPNQRPGAVGTHRGDELIERGLPSRVASQSRPPEQLERHHLGFRCKKLRHEPPERLRLGRPTDCSPSPLERIVDRSDLGLLLHRSHRAFGDSR